MTNIYTTYTTIRLFDGSLCSDAMLVRCRLAEASSPVEVDYCEGAGWQPTQYQAADCGHTQAGLVRLAKELAARSVEVAEDEFHCEWEPL